MRQFACKHVARLRFLTTLVDIFANVITRLISSVAVKKLEEAHEADPSIRENIVARG